VGSLRDEPRAAIVDCEQALANGITHMIDPGSPAVLFSPIADRLAQARADLRVIESAPERAGPAI